MSRSIVHLDADAFFAAVEQAADPRLRGQPVAVGGEKRGIIASASYEARRYGVYTPMPTSRARKLCPKLVLLPGDFEKYERFSRWMFSYAYDFTPEVEVTSIDEGYLDLSGVRRPALEIAETIRQAIRQALKLTVSEGIGSNKLVSQIASKLHKPAAFLCVPPGREISFLHPLPNRWLPGVGPKTAARLDAAGLARIEHVAATPTDLLSLLTGRAAPQLKQFALGIDDRPVVPVGEPAKSYGRQETFDEDQTDEEFIIATLRRMADQLMARVREDGKSIRTLTVKVRYNDLAEDQCGESLPEPTDLETDLYARLPALLRQAWKRRVSLRLVALKFANVYDGFFGGELGLTAAACHHEARRCLAGILDQLRKTHGREVVMRGHDLLLRETPPEPRLQTRVRLVVRRLTPAPESAPPTASGGLGARPGSPPAPRVNRNSAPPERGPSAPPGRILAPRRKTAVPPIPLAVHSYYSFLDSTLSVQAIIELAKRQELPAIALTDRANLHGAVEFTQAARQAGIKPILGAEIPCEGQSLRLYVENATGYRNLCRLLTAWGASPQVEDAASRSGARGNAAFAGGTPSTSSRRRERRAAKDASAAGNSALRGNGARQKFDLSKADLAGLLAVSADARLARFFPDRFYLAVSSPAARDPLPAADSLPRVAMLPARYATPADRWKYALVQSIRTRTLLRQLHPEKDLDGDFHFRAPGAWGELFRAQPEVLAHSHELAGRCTFEMSFGKPQFPAFQPPDGSTPREFLWRLVFAGLRRRYPDRQASLRGQVEEELNIIRQVGYEEYFLVVWDLLHECRRHGIEWITRGSAADSLVCYCLGISDVCPIRFDLYFRRFLNQERMALNKLPDIDIDFPHDRKDDVVDLVFAKYGAEHTAVVGGFSTFQARGAVGDVAKVLGVSEYQVRRFTEHFPWTGARGLRDLLRLSPECRDLPLDEEPYRSALELAEFLDGFPRYPKMHPCGLVLSREPMQQLTPCFISGKGYPATQFDMDAVEAIGLVKMDLLAQGGLAAMRDVKQMLARRGLTVDLNRFAVQPLGDQAAAGAAPAVPARDGTDDDPLPLLPAPGPPSTAPDPWTDPQVWEMIAAGDARAVHHIESPAMVGLCRQCQVRDIDGLVAIVSVIRPGAANEQKKLKFTRRYQGLEAVTYPHPSLEACLQSTFGLVVYEEHVLQICEAFAGLPPGRADVLRRALGKEKLETIAQIQTEFFAAARARGHPEAKITEVWDLLRGFAGYAFCKAHSTAYGVEAYQSAWLKRYFPAEFMAAVLTNGKGFYQPLVYVLECHRLGLGFLPPWVNAPGPGFQVEYGPTTGSDELRASHELPNPPDLSSPPRLRVPIAALKGLTDRVNERILAERARGAFASLSDFYFRVQPTLEEMELLSRAGALDGFGQSRTEQFWETQFLVQRWGQAETTGQGWLLAEDRWRRPSVGGQGTGNGEKALVEPTQQQRLQWEMELFGYTVSGHPLELYPQIAWDTYCPVERLAAFVGQQVTLCGLIIEDRVHQQTTGEPMKFLTLADWTGMVETELFAQTYKTYGLATVRYPVLEITAVVEPFENGRGYSLRVLRAGKPRTKASAS